MEFAGSHPPHTAPADRQLSIAFAMPPWFDVPPKGYGGIESLAASLADALVDRGHDVYIIGAGQNGTRAQFRRTYEVPPSQRIGHPVPEVLNAALSNEYLDHLGVHVVHDHSLAGPLTARGRRMPTVVTAHNTCSGDMGAYYGVISATAAVVAISESQRWLAPRVRWAATVHNAINTADFTYRAAKDDYVLFLGRMAADKGVHVAIDAARAAGRRIILAGKLTESGERRYFDEEVKPRLGPDAEYRGEVDMAAKQDLLAGAYCLLFPIRWEEPFGLVMIEAMASGTPVVAFNRGAVREIVTDGVTGFVRDHPEDLPAAIDKACTIDPAECRRHVEERFDIAVMAARYEAIYLGAVRQSPNRAPAHNGKPDALTAQSL